MGSYLNRIFKVCRREFIYLRMSRLGYRLSLRRDQVNRRCRLVAPLAAGSLMP